MPPVKANNANYANSGMMLISKPLFFLFLGIFVLSVATSGYLLFDKSHPEMPVVKVPQRDTTQKAAADTTTPQQPVQSYEEKRKAIDSATQQAIRDEMEKQTHEKPKSDTGANFVIPDSAKKQQPDNNR
jgi:hypothetical protein